MIPDLRFSDLFRISAIDADGKKFDRVSRLHAKSVNYETTLILDFNAEIFPLHTSDRFTLTLVAPSESVDKLMPEYEYVCYGRCYKYEEVDKTNVAIYISFGGLLLRLQGEYKNLQAFSKGENIHLFIRKY